MATTKLSQIAAATPPILSTDTIIGVQSGTTDVQYTFRQAYFALVANGLRPALPGPTTIYVATTGNDTTGDGTVGNPFATPSKAWTYIGTLDTHGFPVIMQLADGTYPGLNASNGALGQPFGGGTLTIQGNLSDASKVVISDPSFAMVVPSAVSAITVQWLTVTGNGNALILTSQGTLNVAGNMIFGGNTGLGAVVGFGNAAQIFFSATATVNANFNVFFGVYNGAYMDLNGTPSVTASGSLTMSQCFAFASNLSILDNGGGAFSASGSFSGVRYASDSNSVINSEGGGSTLFPGTSAGTTANGGLYL